VSEQVVLSDIFNNSLLTVGASSRLHVPPKTAYFGDPEEPEHLPPTQELLAAHDFVDARHDCPISLQQGMDESHGDPAKMQHPVLVAFKSIP